MKKASIIMSVLSCAIIAAAYTNSVPISTNTRAATEKWTAIRFEPALPPTPENAASKFLTGNREWQTVTAAQIGALTNETDTAALAALAAYAAYWPRNATASSWFSYVTNSGAITITGYNIAGGTDVVIPDYINGLPVTEIGANAFANSGIVSLIAPQTVTSIEDVAFYFCSSLTSVSLPQVQTVGNAFSYCNSLTSVSLPQVQTVGENAFSDCSSLTSVSLPLAQTVGNKAFDGCTSLTSVYFDNDAPTIGEEIFADISPNQVTIYVTNPQATGWGATLGGMPVVRPPLYADAIYQAGELVATTGHVAQVIASQLPGIVYSNSVSALTIYTNASGAATSWWAVASGVTNSGSFASGTPGAITNGQNNALLGGITLTNNHLLIGIDTPVSTSGFGGGQNNHLIYRSPSGVNSGLAISGDGSQFIQFSDLNFNATADFGVFGEDIYFVNRKYGALRFGHVTRENEMVIAADGNVNILNSLTVSKTNTAAVVVSQGPVFFGPTISGKQAHIFTDGTNTFQVDVNDLTNQFATVADVTGIIAPLIASGTNITVTSTQSVYSVAVTNAGPVGIDWSGLALDGTGRAEITLRLNVTEWAGTNVTFSPALTFDQQPEILVTGVWEFAASTVDGVATRVRQTWPECCGWQPVVISAAGVSQTVGTWWQMPVAATNYVYWQAVNKPGLVRMRLMVSDNYGVDVDLYSSYAAAGNTTFSALDVVQSKSLSFPNVSPGEYTVSLAVPQPVYPNRGVKIWVAPVGQYLRIYNLKHRDFNANERAAYEAGWRP